MQLIEQTETREQLIAQLVDLEANEPDCECFHCAGGPDEMDASCCDYHRGDSAWNRERERIEAAIARLDYFAARTRKPAASEPERRVA